MLCNDDAARINCSTPSLSKNSLPISVIPSVARQMTKVYYSTATTSSTCAPLFEASAFSPAGFLSFQSIKMAPSSCIDILSNPLSGDLLPCIVGDEQRTTSQTYARNDPHAGKHLFNVSAADEEVARAAIDSAQAAFPGMCPCPVRCVSN